MLLLTLGFSQNSRSHCGMDLSLWQACAGSLAYIPQPGDLVFYFPQGHLAQIKAIVGDSNELLPREEVRIPSKILCRVVSVELKADLVSDEVYAHVTLLPESNHHQILASSLPITTPSQASVEFFFKRLTQSDTCTHGGFTVPKRHAVGILPPLDFSMKRPSQHLVATDLHGKEWCFIHIFRGNPGRHLLTSGWSSFVNSKGLVPGDTFVFLRNESGELRVGLRRARSHRLNSLASVISIQSLELGVIASARHAITTGTAFTVYYYPWSLSFSSEFLVPVDRYTRSIDLKLGVSARYEMLLEDEHSLIQRFKGTIVAEEDEDHIRWPHSDWRRLKVQWDEVPTGFALTARLSPWNIVSADPTNGETPAKQHLKQRVKLQRTETMHDVERCRLFGVNIESASPPSAMAERDCDLSLSSNSELSNI